MKVFEIMSILKQIGTTKYVPRLYLLIDIIKMPDGVVSVNFFLSFSFLIFATSKCQMYLMHDVTVCNIIHVIYFTFFFFHVFCLNHS